MSIRFNKTVVACVSMLALCLAIGGSAQTDTVKAPPLAEKADTAGEKSDPDSAAAEEATANSSAVADSTVDTQAESTLPADDQPGEPQEEKSKQKDSSGATPGAAGIAWSGEAMYRVFQIYQPEDLADLRERNINWGDERQADGGAWVHQVSGQLAVTFRTSVGLAFTVGYRAGYGIGSGISESKVHIDKERWSLTAGIFNYKYNKDARNLGEYLILSGAYPGYVFSGREWAYNVGLLFHTELLPGLNQDILVTTDMENIPYDDISIAYVGSYTLGEQLTLGAGVSFHRLISLNPDLTTPDTVSVNDNFYEFTHRGIKVMARVAWDPKKLLGSPAIFGGNDLKVYAEAAILGVKNYGYYYDKRAERIPVMVGLNLPAFGLLDYCALEGEWYGSPNNNVRPKDGYSAVPTEKAPGSADDVKWSLSLKRSLVPSVTLHARIASDHLRLEDAGGGVERLERNTDSSHWYWSTWLRFSF